MKRSFKIVIPILFVIATSQVFAEEVVVTPNVVNALVQAAAAADSGDIMLLEYGAVFPNEGSVIINKELTIKATGDASLAKPYIKQIPNQAGDYGSQTLEVHANLTLINIQFDGDRGTGSNNDRCVRVKSVISFLRIDSCAFANYKKRTLGINASVLDSTVITNSIFPACRKMAQIEEGRSIDLRAGPHGLVKIQNCTFVNSTDRWIRHRIFASFDTPPVDTLIVDHNTFIHNLGYRPPFQFGSVKNVQFTNNIVVNPAMLGTDTLSDRINDVSYTSPLAVTNVGPQAICVFSVLQADTFNTKIIMKNNNVYREQEVLDKYATSTRIEIAPLYNAEFEALIDPYPYYGATFKEVLTFADVPAAPLSMVDSFISQLDTITITDPKPSITHFANQMEYIPYDSLDASYGTAAVSYTAAAGGFPLGDLNWYPDKKQAWQEWIDAGMPVSVERTDLAVPAEFRLAQNYPNPFNPSTTIEFELKNNAYVKLSVYNMLGQRVRNLVDQKQTAGRYLVQWDGMDENGKAVSSGIYFYRIETESFSATKKMLLIR